MAKGYWIAHVDVVDADGYKAYLSANAIPFAKYGGRFLVRAGRSEPKEGALRSRHVVIEFKDYATALACYQSEEYRRALALRLPVSQGDLVVVEGYDGPQPG
ncbi:MAG: DUF1330 domain-containing protein [Roseiarcus sp.]